MWFPDRRLIFVGDAGYGTHEVARFASGHRLGLTLVSKLHPDANLFEPPPPYTGQGRPRVKGAALPKPRQAAAQARRLRRRTVAWYGGGTRRVGLLSRTGHWSKAGAGLVPIRWVFVRDRDGTHRDEFFFSTDPTLDPVRIIETYTARWNLETTFQELRALLGLETTRGRCQTCCSMALHRPRRPRKNLHQSSLATFYVRLLREGRPGRDRHGLSTAGQGM
jgi:hypothetical protein